MDFEFIHRDYKKSLVLIPGWGFCSDIFSSLNLSYNYILPERPVYRDISIELYNFLLKKNIAKVSILGWSLGAYVALDFQAGYSDMVEAVYAISLRRAFDHEELTAQLKALEADRIVALRQFYRRCFLGQRADYQWFSSALEESGIRQWNMPGLRKGLTYLKGKTANFSKCAGTQLRIFHGEKDVIAPLDKVPEPPPGVAINVIPGTGHLPFLSSEFKRKLCVS
ncbi:MAG: alpha/beta hydrolase [Thermodesulfobacteriota bacterium]|nr:alpha/beta hydrolase [Thermodesulfobacteriota bacterium]